MDKGIIKGHKIEIMHRLGCLKCVAHSYIPSSWHSLLKIPLRNVDVLHFMRTVIISNIEIFINITLLFQNTLKPCIIKSKKVVYCDYFAFLIFSIFLFSHSIFNEELDLITKENNPKHK